VSKEKKIKKYGPAGFCGPGPNMSFKSKDKPTKESIQKGLLALIERLKKTYSCGGGGLEASMDKPKKEDKIIPWNPDIKKPKLEKETESSSRNSSTPPVGAVLHKEVKKSEDLCKAFEDRWLLEFGDKFKKMSETNQLSYEFKTSSQGSQRDYIFKIGDCTVTYSTIGSIARIRLDNTSDKGIKVAKALYYGIQRAHDPLIKNEGKMKYTKEQIKKALETLIKDVVPSQGGSRGGFNVYSQNWGTQGLAGQELVREKRRMQHAQRGKAGIRRPIKSTAQRRLNRQQFRLWGLEQEKIGKSEIEALEKAQAVSREKVGALVGALKDHLNSSPYKGTHSNVGRHFFGPKQQHTALATEMVERQNKDQKVHTTSHNIGGATFTHISTWKPKTGIKKTGKLYFDDRSDIEHLDESNIKVKEEDARHLGLHGLDQVPAKKEPKKLDTKKTDYSSALVLSERGADILDKLYKAFGLNPTYVKKPSTAKAPNIARQAGKPRIHAGASIVRKFSAGGPPLPKVKAPTAAIKPAAPKVVKPKIASPKSIKIG